MGSGFIKNPDGSLVEIVDKAARTGLGNVYTKDEIDANKADIDSPAFEGTPTAPTAEIESRDTQIATTKFVHNAIKDIFVDKYDNDSYREAEFTSDDFNIVTWITPATDDATWGNLNYGNPGTNAFLADKGPSEKTVIHPGETLVFDYDTADSLKTRLRLFFLYTKLSQSADFRIVNNSSSSVLQVNNCKILSTYDSYENFQNHMEYTNTSEYDEYFSFLLSYDSSAVDGMSVAEKVEYATNFIPTALNLLTVSCSIKANNILVSPGVLNSTEFTGTPTIDGEQIATVPYIDTKYELVSQKYDRIDELAEAIRGRSILTVTSAPYANIYATPDGKVHTMSLNKAEVIAESGSSEVFEGDIIIFNGSLYKVAYIGYPMTNGGKVRDVYIDSIGSIVGPQGPQGIQGNQGPQGPKGDPGEGYFIVTDEDYSKIADFVEEKSYHSYQRPDSSEPIRPNIFYDFGQQYQLEITFEAPQSIYRSNEYMFQFESPSDRPTTLIVPSTVRWCYEPVIEAGKTYQVSVLNDLAVICGA